MTSSLILILQRWQIHPQTKKRRHVFSQKGNFNQNIFQNPLQCLKNVLLTSWMLLQFFESIENWPG